MRVVGKILSAIIVGLLSVVLFALDQVAKVYSLVAGVFYIFMGICILLAVISQQWTALGILGIMIAVSIALFFVMAEVIVLIDHIKARLALLLQ